jgi:hypothetical protein
MHYLHIQDSVRPHQKIERENLNSRLELLTQHYLQQPQGSRSVYTIPVVVHIVYKNSTENISFSQIQSQIDVLNRDFRKLNSDVGQTPSAWSGIAADVGIEFCLAQRDPSGNPTDGILRVPTNMSSFSMADEVKFSNLGGSDAWPSDSYLNLWVCDLSSGLLGYAQFPGGGSPTTDGVVINYTNFGTEGTATPPYHKGRTATHEIAHWLNLLHIWGDEPQCAADDQVSDTPQQKDSNGGCPTFPLVSGSGASCSDPNGAMFMNYMDYVYDNCMFMFTNGQKARMLAALNNFRLSLTTSDACIPLTPGDTLCDTVSNFMMNHTQSLFRPSDIGTPGMGWVSGTNSFEDKAKADFFNVQLNSWQALHGIYVYFGYAFISDPNTVINITIWDDNGPNGTPGTVLGSRPLTMSNIGMQIQAGLPVFLTLSPALGFDGSFYAGVEYPQIGMDTIAIVTNNIGESSSNTAWEKWSDNTWHAYTESLSWQLSLAHAIFPVYCSVVGESETDQSSPFRVFPVPANQEVFLMPQIRLTGHTDLQIFDMAGRLVKAMPDFSSADGLLRVNTASLPAGFYNFRIRVDGKYLHHKVVVSHP